MTAETLCDGMLTGMVIAGYGDVGCWLKQELTYIASWSSSFLTHLVGSKKIQETQVHTYIGTSISIPQHSSTAVRSLIG
jgi:hypothetical protein